MPRPPSLNRVLLLGWIMRTRIGTNQFGEKYFTFTLATSRFVDNGGTKTPSNDMHYVTIFGEENVKRAAREIKYKAHVMVEGFLRYFDKREVNPDGSAGRIKQRYTYIQVDYWQLCKEGSDERPPIEHSSTFREGVDPEGLRRNDSIRDKITKEKSDGQGQD